MPDFARLCGLSLTLALSACLSPGEPGPELDVYVDPSDDEVWRAFGRAPSPAFVYDAGGRLVLRQVWLDPNEIGAVLDDLLETKT